MSSPSEKSGPALPVSSSSAPVESEGSGAPARPARDVVLVHGVTDDRRGLRVIRARDERLEVGEVRPLESGKPLTGDVVRLVPRPDAPYLCDVETAVDLRAVTSGRASGGRASGEEPLRADVRAPRPAQEKPRSGPAQVATDAYRQNWDAIWRRPPSGSRDVN